MIGKQGRTAAALRTLAATAGEKEGKTVTLEIRDTPLTRRECSREAGTRWRVGRARSPGRTAFAAR